MILPEQSESAFERIVAAVGRPPDVISARTAQAVVSGDNGAVGELPHHAAELVGDEFDGAQFSNMPANTKLTIAAVVSYDHHGRTNIRQIDLRCL